MTFSSPLLYLPPRVHPQLHLSNTTKQVWACGPQETLLVISLAFEFRQGPDPSGFPRVWTVAGVEFGLPCLLAPVGELEINLSANIKL